ncbi:unnamed protein product [Ilex paraguariensis]|uniref:Uncharacterized protein n=1 Tax=Ilex paraguariensis TaxID=185542 RepID=A0ABC8R9M4_9AQUA
MPEKMKFDGSKEDKDLGLKTVDPFVALYLICGSPGSPPITAPRIKLRDGRHLAYKEHGVPKETAKYKIISVHGFASTRHTLAVVASRMAEELGVYFVSFDKPGGLVMPLSTYLTGWREQRFAPVINYWWPGFPAIYPQKPTTSNFHRTSGLYGVAHFIPWLTYWWNTQKWFPPSSVIAQRLSFLAKICNLYPSLENHKIPG